MSGRRPQVKPPAALEREKRSREQARRNALRLKIEELLPKFQDLPHAITLLEAINAALALGSEELLARANYHAIVKLKAEMVGKTPPKEGK